MRALKRTSHFSRFASDAGLVFLRGGGEAEPFLVTAGGETKAFGFVRGSATQDPAPLHRAPAPQGPRYMQFGRSLGSRLACLTAMSDERAAAVTMGDGRAPGKLILLSWRHHYGFEGYNVLGGSSVPGTLWSVAAFETNQCVELCVAGSHGATLQALPRAGRMFTLASTRAARGGGGGSAADTLAAAALSGADGVYALGRRDGVVQVFDARAPAVVVASERLAPFAVSGLAVPPAGGAVAVASVDGSLALWDVRQMSAARGPLVRFLARGGTRGGCAARLKPAIDARGEFLALGDSDGGLSVWALRSGGAPLACVAPPLPPKHSGTGASAEPPNLLCSLAFDDQERAGIFAGGADGVVHATL